MVVTQFLTGEPVPQCTFIDALIVGMVFWTIGLLAMKKSPLKFGGIAITFLLYVLAWLLSMTIASTQINT
ncbi:MAG: hypothetical protein V1726_01740 [Methanobacteriota archaeon]